MFQVCGDRHLKYYVSMAGPELLSVSKSAHSQMILKRIAREATFTYQTLTLSEENAANVIYLNGNFLHKPIEEIPESFQIINDKIDIPRIIVNFAELGKQSSGISSSCILLRKSRYIRNL